MDIMHACDFYTFPMAKKRKEKKKQANACISKDLESYFSAKSPPYLPTLQKCYSKYSICAMPLYSKACSFLLCNSKLMEK
jgi:hypothetical protein